MGLHTFFYEGLALVSRKQLQSCSASPTPSPAVSAGIWGPCGGERGSLGAQAPEAQGAAQCDSSALGAPAPEAHSWPP